MFLIWNLSTFPYRLHVGELDVTGFLFVSQNWMCVVLNDTLKGKLDDVIMLINLIWREIKFNVNRVFFCNELIFNFFLRFLWIQYFNMYGLWREDRDRARALSPSPLKQVYGTHITRSVWSEFF